MYHNERLIYHGIMDVDYNRRDVSVEHFCDAMSYCKHQSDMNAPQYLHADAPPGYLCY
jgi:hypothetical protein